MSRVQALGGCLLPAVNLQPQSQPRSFLARDYALEDQCCRRLFSMRAPSGFGQRMGKVGGGATAQVSCARYNERPAAGKEKPGVCGELEQGRTKRVEVCDSCDADAGSQKSLCGSAVKRSRSLAWAARG